MPNRLGHRRFGNVRRLPSGRYQIRYPGPDGRMRAGAETYERLTSARWALALIEAQLVTGEWTDPIGRKIRLRSYAERWIAHHAGLRPRTRELYAWLLSAHIIPYLGAMPLGSITPDTVREWRATLLSAGVSQTATAKAYRLLRAVLMTATEDRIIPRNPCRIRGVDGLSWFPNAGHRLDFANRVGQLAAGAVEALDGADDAGTRAVYRNGQGHTGRCGRLCR
jgi:hypothetical protein